MAAHLVQHAGRDEASGAAVKISWKTFAPVVVWLVLYLIPVPTPDFERKRTREWTRVKTNR